MLDAKGHEPRLKEIREGLVWRLKIPMRNIGRNEKEIVYNGSSNAYLVRAREEGMWYIIDTGQNNEDGMLGWNMAIETLGLTPGCVKAILLTHYHPDHAGMSGWLSGHLKAPVYMHPKDIESYQSESSDVEKNVARVHRVMMLYGMRGEYMQMVDDQVRGRSHLSGSFHDFLPMEEGSCFEVCHGALRAVAAPGHTDGQCMFDWPEENMLFSADFLLPASYAPIVIRGFGDMDPVGTSIKSLDSLSETLFRTQTVLPGHGWNFEDPAGRAAETKAAYLAQVDEVYAMCAGGMETAWEMALEKCRKADNYSRVRLFAWQVMADLSYLYRQGRLARETVCREGSPCYCFHPAVGYTGGQKD